ncbi:phage tail assembly protein (plasmid) [Rouxiella badensis]|uniref:Uncharacterized protein n=1 Tax=Rouxiella badensis TaxID=1646377 RepID=A0A1X0WB04_9GAMM|nr:phage tail assembly protein [Rouxiella badensis]ORJ23960.1 hypothetical protein BS640_18845 [Rouxiella badensis]WAT03209.1 phage tail assembly protein [Rouxiella badensis]WAT03239.1 phage tail assembly protein [Rouxiella badensis]WAT03270.1 phage tail assembly protein [Rouxiella badensis]
MSGIFDLNFGPGGAIPLREPKYFEVSDFYKEKDKTDQHEAMASLMAKISGQSRKEIAQLPIKVFREGHAFLLEYLNYWPTVEQDDSYIIQLDNVITSLNGVEGWNEVALREPVFSEFSQFNAEAKKTSDQDAMGLLMSLISGVNRIAITKMPISKYREGSAYLMGFLTYFPKSKDGGTESPS